MKLLSQQKTEPMQHHDHHDCHPDGHETPFGTAADVIYTCPMHPQVRQTGPGNCPICDMTLDPLTVALSDKPDPELISMTRRF